MGKARILSHLGHGLYSVRVLLDTVRIDLRRSQINAEVAALDHDIVTLAARRAAAAGDAILAESALNSAITAGADATYVTAAEEVWRKAQAASYEAESTYAYAVARQASLNLELAGLASVPEYRDTQAWCADWTGDLTGDVGTIEVGNHDGDVPMQIRPGYNGGATHSTQRDGQMQPLRAGVPEAVFYNAAILPGIERWRPLYAHGRIVRKNDETGLCVVEYTDGPRKGEWAEGVAVSYMTCNSLPFVVGDDVVVQFDGRNIDKPVIIGFQAEPRPCVAVCLEISGLYVNVSDSSGNWQPFFDEWQRRYSERKEYVRRFGQYRQAWTNAYNSMTPDQQWFYGPVYDIVIERANSMVEETVPLEAAWYLVYIFPLLYNRAWDGVISWRPLKASEYISQGSSSIAGLFTCIPGDVQTVETPIPAEVRSPEYRFAYSLTENSEVRLGATVKVWWNPNTGMCGVSIYDIEAADMNSQFGGASPVLGHTVYMDGVQIGTRTPSGLNISSQYTVADKSTHHINVVTSVRMPAIPDGSIPPLSVFDDATIPCQGTEVPPAAHLVSTGTTDLPVHGGAFDIFVVKRPEEATPQP